MARRAQQTNQRRLFAAQQVGNVDALSKETRDALASPLRLEILGLFTAGRPLSIAEMGVRMGRRPVSLYHHVGLLERAGLLRRAGSRRIGKRDAALFEVTGIPLALEVDPCDQAGRELALRGMSAAFRMAERDLEAALEQDDPPPMEGPERTFFATRLHIRASRAWLARLNSHLAAIEQLLSEATSETPSPEDLHVSLTLALLPLRGRNADLVAMPEGGSAADDEDDLDAAAEVQR